ncbi:5-oxoprolinase subunit PxpA [Photobacterium sp. TY1-4]|uniref:5-oxoprolinase subunit PxpA n=1 Tax=Photobacterium sp. TY1-4 TaxID=2899122 RepID=UPI0021BE3608|nr:5-oxoprolinase subunit PxpA [Photobacterium sp. TY1-4]UXI00196.1 5-oxoprolinase subunit PxpA [Photobacterium sp. TY1-4]
MKLNCDMGESYGIWQMGNDHAVMSWIDMANIACGFHASDPDVMAETVASALAHGVEIGAHPGYDDKPGFGRRSIPHLPESITQLVAYQAGALEAICRLQGGHVRYVKPHGALYHDMMASEAIFEAMLRAVAGLNQFAPMRAAEPVKLMIQARADNEIYQGLARRYAVELLFEAFADRAYRDDGNLVPRSESGAVHRDPARIEQQIRELAVGEVTTVTGNRLALQADTVCVHGDNDESVAMIARLHQVLNP